MLTTVDEAIELRYGQCEGLPHDWSETQPGYETITGEPVRWEPDHEAIVALLKLRLSCGSEPWRLCLRCQAMFTWTEWHAARDAS